MENCPEKKRWLEQFHNRCLKFNEIYSGLTANLRRYFFACTNEECVHVFRADKVVLVTGLGSDICPLCGTTALPVEEVVEKMNAVTA